jgi:hypothetical protein
MVIIIVTFLHVDKTERNKEYHFFDALQIHV